MLTRRQHARIMSAEPTNSLIQHNHCCVSRTVRSKTHIQTTGMHYPLLPANPTPCRFVAVVNPKTNDLPFINVGSKLANPNNSLVHPTIITIDRRRFLVFGYFDPQVPQNLNLREAFPHIPWHGEIVVFSLGRRVRVLSRPSGTKYTMAKVLEMYIRAATEARGSNDEHPAQLSYFSQSLFV